MTDRTFLDVDDTVLASKLILPGNEDNQEIDEFLKQFESKPFSIVQPAPGACVKAKTENGEKIFVNICTTSKIPPPEDISDIKLLEILSEESPSFTIPMSIGNERLEDDKGGAPCLTYDVAINDKYFQKCQNNKTFWVFTISVALDGVGNKFNKTIDTDNYVVLKNRKVVGKLQEHRIENREVKRAPQCNKPLIEEVSNTSSTNPPAKGNISTDCRPSTNNDPSKYVILKEPLDGKTKQLIGLYEMPIGIESKDLSVLVNPDRIVITVEKKELSYDASIPYDIDVEKVEALLDKNMRILRLNMPVVQV